MRGLIALVCFCIASATLHADQSTGTIRISVVEKTGSQVLVDISSDSAPSRHWTGTIDPSTPATFTGLPPGSYRVVATLPNRGSVTLVLDLGPAELVQLAASTIGSRDVPGTISIIDRQPQGHVTVFGPRDLRVLPAGGSVDALVETAAPFVIVDAIDGGGLDVARSRLIGNRAASGRQTTMRVGEIELMARPESGVTALVPEPDVFEAVVVASGLGRPDIVTPGASITLAPRRPGVKFAGAFDASFSGSGLVSRNALPTAPSDAVLRAWNHVNIQASAPLNEQTGLFVSQTVTRARKLEAARSGDTPIDVSSTFAHAVSQVTPRDQVRLLAMFQRLTHEFDGRAQFTGADATERDRVSQAQAVWAHQRDAGARVEMSVGVQHGSFTPEIPSAAGGVVDRVFDGVVPPAAAASTANRLDARVVVDLSERRHWIGSHALQFGWLASRSTSAAHIVAAPTVAELVGGVPARVWVRTIPGVDSSRHVTATTAYVADRIAASEHLTLDAGFGVGFSSGSAGPSASSASWATWSPRVSFRWAPRALTVFGGVSRYQPPLSLDHVAFGDPGEAMVQVYRWNDVNGNRQLDPGEMPQVLIARAGRSPDVASIDPALRAPYTHEWTLGLERRLTRHSLVRAIAVVRNEHDIVRSVNVGAPVSAYVPRQIADQGEDYSSPADDRLLTVYDRLSSSFGQDRFVLMNTADRGYGGGVELTYVFNTTRWTSMFGAMAYRTDGFGGSRGFRATENDQGVLGEFLENPNAASYADGRMFFDRSYVAKWTTTYQAPHDLSFAIIARYQDGQPFSRVVVATGLAQGAEPVAAYRAGRTRFTFTTTTDVRIEQGLRVVGHRAALRLDVFNLTNDANEVEENPLTGPAFRMATRLQPPRTVRLGFRFEF